VVRLRNIIVRAQIVSGKASDDHVSNGLEQKALMPETSMIEYKEYGDDVVKVDKELKNCARVREYADDIVAMKRACTNP